MDELGKPYISERKSVTKVHTVVDYGSPKYGRFYLYKMSRIGKSIRTEGK